MPKTLNITDEERALLTPEELAGMQEGEDFDEGEGEGEGEGEDGEEGADTTAEAGAADDKSGQNDDDDDGQQDDDQGNADDTAAAEASAAAAAAAASTTTTDDAATAEADEAEVSAFSAVKPLPVSRLPEDFDDKVKAIETGKTELGTKLDEGDITTSEYHAELDKLNKQERDLEKQKDRHDSSEQQRYATWTGVHVQALFERHPEYKANEMLTGLLDQEVKKLQATDKYASDTDPKILLDAHKKIAAALPSSFAAAKPAGKDAAKPAAKPAPKASAPTLAKVPASDTADTSENEFSYLDALLDRDPNAYEKALEKLSRTDPAKYDAYLAQ